MLEMPFQETGVETRLAQGRVSEVEGGRFVVETSWGCRICFRAAGCLVEPQRSDLVLVALAGAEAERSYIMTVLERADAGSPVRLTLHDGASIEALPGRIAIHAEEETALSSAGRVSATGDTLDFTAREGRLKIRFLSMAGHRFDAVWQECQQTVTTMKTVCMRSIQNLGDSLRRVKNVDETHASHVRTLASETLYAQGKFVNHTASEVVKIDGREVHLG